jgi:prevent-host-death family protein
MPGSVLISTLGVLDCPDEGMAGAPGAASVDALWTPIGVVVTMTRMVAGPDLGVVVTQFPLRRAKACFSELVARADLLGEVTVLTKHGRPAAAIVPAGQAAGAAGAQVLLDELWSLLDRCCPPGTDRAMDEVRVRHRRLPAAAAAGPVIAAVGS